MCLSGILSSPSWVCMHPYARVQAPNDQEYSGADQGPLLYFIIQLLLLTSWVSCQSDIFPNQVSISDLLRHWPSSFICHQDHYYVCQWLSHWICPHSAPNQVSPLPLQSCCFQGFPHLGRTTVLTELRERRGVVLRLILSTFTTFYFNTEIIY